MKLILASLLLITFSATTLCAQTMQETVYLKNGSIINGTVIEQVPGQSLKIQTKDGSIFAYQMSEVEKITKSTASTSYKRHTISNGNIKTGYRGFIDLDWSSSKGFITGAYSIGATTSHGYQIVPQLYIGVGAGVNYYYKGTAVNLPIFADIRTDIINAQATPFVDVKIGYSLLDCEGLYLSPSLGCRISLGNTMGLNIGVGYTLQKYKYVPYDYIKISSINVKIGIDF